MIGNIHCFSEHEKQFNLNDELHSEPVQALHFDILI